MTSLPPKIDQRTYEEIVQQTEAFVEDYTNELERGWKSPGAIEVEPKSELLTGMILNQKIPIIVEAKVDNLKGRILNQDIDLGDNLIIKKGTQINDSQAQRIVQIKENQLVEVLLAARNTLIDATLAQQISQIKELKQVKVKVQPSSVIEVEQKYWVDQILAEDIGSELKSGTVITEAIAKKIEDQGRSKVKIKIKVETDAGQALIRIFGRLVTKVSDRLNQVPEKNFIAFLDLIGGQLQPPQPAKVPLTFYLAEASPVGSFVPVHTQISATPLEGNDEEIIFETEQELIVTTAQLKAVFVREPFQDRYSDYTSEAIGQKERAFLVFEGEQDIQHSLYLTLPEIFALPELKDLKLTINDENNQFQNLTLNWSYWNGSQWNTIENPSLENNKFTFTNLPIPVTTEINGQREKWLQVNINSLFKDGANLSKNFVTSLPQITDIAASIAIQKSQLIPEVCLFNSSPLDLSKNFAPFGEQPQLNDTFYVALHDTFIKPNTIITIEIILAHRPVSSPDLEITWEVGNGQEWQEIVTENENDQVKWLKNTQKIKFTEGSQVQAQLKFPTQEKLPFPSTVNGETRYWIRARITQGHYGEPASKRQYPIYDDLAILTKQVSQKSQSVEVDNVELFEKGNTIRFFPLNQEQFPEEHQIVEITRDNKSLILKIDSGIINNNLPIGTRIMRKSILTETIPAIYDPPVIKSLKLTYEFNLTEKAIYFAKNDFNYFQSKLFGSKLKQIANEGDRFLILDSVEGLNVGEFLTINSDNPENHQIEMINKETSKVILDDKISKNFDINATVTRHFRPFTPTIDKNPSLYLGFDKPFGNQTVTLYVQVNPPSAQELSQAITRSNPQLIWEYFSFLGWQTLGVNDETKAFSHRGLIQFIARSDFKKSTIFNQDLYWLRVRWQGGNFSIQPHLHRILTNTTWAVQATTIQEEILGSSNYEAHQTFTARYSPILMGEKLEIRENKIPELLDSDKLTVIRDDLGEIEEIWVTWQAVPDFYSSTESDRHYLLDRQTGQIRFGDGQTGMIPPRGRNNIRLSFYRVGGGEQGNLVSQSVNQLKTTVPYIDRVVNLEAAAGGADQEKLERLKERVPKQLRHRNRAVTLQDIEDLAYEASTDVARVKLITPDLMISEFIALNGGLWLDPTNPQITFEEYLNNKQGVSDLNQHEIIPKIMNNSGKVKLIVLPNSKKRQPNPSLALLEKVESYIRSRCEAMLDLTVTVPQWQEIIVTASITPTTYQGLDRLRETINQRLESFLHPLTGGSGDGWRFGRYPQKSDFYSLIQSISGVDHVDSLDIKINPDPKSPELVADSLIFSGHHIINLKSSGGN